MSYGGFDNDRDDAIRTLDATYLVAKEAKTALEETRKARAKALPTDMDNWESGLKLKGLHFKGFEKPPTLVCYLCSREFGTFSLKIHHDTCKKKYMRAQEKLPRRERKPLPDPPTLRAPSQKDEFSLFTAYNAEAQRIYNDFVMHRCPRCERSFAEYSTLRSHMKRCDAPTREERERMRQEAARLKAEADAARREAQQAARAEAAARRKEAMAARKAAGRSRGGGNSDEAAALRRAKKAEEEARRLEEEANKMNKKRTFLRKGGGKMAANSRKTVEDAKQRLQRREKAFLKTGIYKDDFDDEDDDHEPREKPILRDVLKDRYGAADRPSTVGRSKRPTTERREPRRPANGRGRGGGRNRGSSSQNSPIDFEPYEPGQATSRAGSGRRRNRPQTVDHAPANGRDRNVDRPTSSRKGSRQRSPGDISTDLHHERSRSDTLNDFGERNALGLDASASPERGYGDYPAPRVRSNADALTPRRGSPKNAAQGRAMLAQPSDSQGAATRAGNAHDNALVVGNASQLQALSIDEVHQWLCSQNLRAVADNFKADDVDGAELFEISTMEELEEYGVGKRAKLKKLLRVLDDIRSR